MNMKHIYLIIFILVFVLAGSLFAFIQTERQVQKDIKESIKLVLGNKVIEDSDNVYVENNDIYFSIEFIEDYLLYDIEASEDGKRAILNLANSEFELETLEITEYVKDNNTKINIPLKINNDNYYIPIKGLHSIFGINISYIDTSNVVVVDEYTSKITMGKVNVDSIKLKLEPDFKSFTLDKIKLDEEIRVFEEVNEWYQVRTKEGYIGYIEKKHLETYEEEIEPFNQVNIVREDMDKSKDINITWEYVYEKTPDISTEEKIEGLDVVAPTWFSMGKDGFITNNADFDYVIKAHDKGYKVWGLVDNSFDPEITSQVINNDELKKNVIAQIAMYASLYNLDGINIDFENIYYEDKDSFALFVEELCDILKKQNLIVSIDVTVPGGSKQWSLVYDRERIAKAVDYVALMAYDEHWATSPKSGSVASIGWVEKGIVRSLETIPKDKLLLGIPFYTRVWEETIDEDGKTIVSSKAIAIKNADKIITENDAQVVWDEKTGQHFATYEKDGSIYKIWLEDSKSIELKAKLAQKYGLKGIASWRKGYEYQEIWEVIKTVMDDKKLL